MLRGFGVLGLNQNVADDPAALRLDLEDELAIRGPPG
jgi:hypothetical protein